MVSPWILFVGVEPGIRNRVTDTLRTAGLMPMESGSREGPGIVVAASAAEPTCEVLENLHQHGDVRTMVLLTGTVDVAPEQMVRLRHSGAEDILPFDDTSACGDAVLARMSRWHAIEALFAVETSAAGLIACDPAVRRTLRNILEVAAFTQDPIVLLGASGTGKEQVARLVHRVDSRPHKGEFVVLDCTTVAPELAASEFFGHERGAFTGALTPRDGAFALADRGTLFLDEVGELAPTMQAQLLRVAQEKSFKRLGGNEWQRTSFRMVCATHRDIEVDDPHRPFRRDFFHRISRWVFRLPTLAERPEDILPLAEHFSRLLLGTSPGFDASTRAHLAARDYGGNVRELSNLIGRLCGRHVGPGPIRLGDVASQDLPARITPMTEVLGNATRQALRVGLGLKEIARMVRDTAVRTALAMTDGSVAGAARILQISDRALQMELAKRD